MESEMEAGGPSIIQTNRISKAKKLTLLLLNAALLTIGNAGGPLILRLYFLRGGSRKWLSSWLQTGGWPLVLIPLFLSYIDRRRKSGGNSTNVFFITPGLFAACVVFGIFTGMDDYMYAYGATYLPVSTSSILISSQLAFNAVFALLVIKHRFTLYSINAVLLLSVGALVLGIHSDSGRRRGQGRRSRWDLGRRRRQGRLDGSHGAAKGGLGFEIEI